MLAGISINFDIDADWQWPLLVVMTLVWLGLLVHTLRRPNRRRLAFRILLLTAAMVSIVLAGLRPYSYREESSMTAILLTQDY
ncbi:MAG: hypothetical protein AAFO94_09310, partial [Bacteroidota bacterium]